MGWFEDFLENKIDLQCLDEKAYHELLSICRRQGVKNVDGGELAADNVAYKKGLCITCIDGIYDYTYIVRYQLKKGENRIVRPLRPEDFEDLEE